jgi:hypothetical protein
MFLINEIYAPSRKFKNCPWKNQLNHFLAAFLAVQALLIFDCPDDNEKI